MLNISVKKNEKVVIRIPNGEELIIHNVREKRLYLSFEGSQTFQIKRVSVGGKK